MSDAPTSAPDRTAGDAAGQSPASAPGAPGGVGSPGRDARVTVLRRPPDADPVPLVVSLAEGGPVIVAAPTLSHGRTVAGALRAEGLSVAVVPAEWAQAAAGADVVIGTRTAVWAPTPALGGIMVLDEHDESLQQQQAPTWHARDVAVERARRAGVPCVLVSPVPSLAALALVDPPGPPARLSLPSRAEERAGWPVVDVIDRRREAPGRLGLFSDRLVPHLHRPGRVLCVLNRTGRSRLLACAACGELTRCEHCDAALGEVEAGRLDCRACGRSRPRLCAACGSRSLKNLRLGVGRAREELAALVREPVGEVTAATEVAPTERVVVGTEAALHQYDRAAVVAFLDVDQELIAPRYRAAEQALGLLARAARLLGGRADGGRLAVQTRVPDHEVIQAVLHADPGRIVEPEMARRTLLSFPPVTAVASVAGPGAPEFVQSLETARDVEILGPRDDAFLVRAEDATALADCLAIARRPADRTRVHVDPPRL